MRVVTKRTLVEYYLSHASSKTALEEWYFRVEKAKWNNLNDLKKQFPSADYVGNYRVVFNIKGNDYRLIVIVKYEAQKVYIRWVGTHAEYDKIDATNV